MGYAAWTYREPFLWIATLLVTAWLLLPLIRKLFWKGYLQRFIVTSNTLRVEYPVRLFRRKVKEIPLNHLRAIHLEVAEKEEEEGGSGITISVFTISNPGQKLYRLVAVTGDDQQNILGNPLLAEEAAIVNYHIDRFVEKQPLDLTVYRNLVQQTFNQETGVKKVKISSDHQGTRLTYNPLKGGLPLITAAFIAILLIGISLTYLILTGEGEGNEWQAIVVVWVIMIAAAFVLLTRYPTSFTVDGSSLSISGVPYRQKVVLPLTAVQKVDYQSVPYRRIVVSDLTILQKVYDKYKKNRSFVLFALTQDDQLVTLAKGLDGRSARFLNQGLNQSLVGLDHDPATSQLPAAPGQARISLPFARRWHDSLSLRQLYTGPCQAGASRAGPLEGERLFDLVRSPE